MGTAKWVSEWMVFGGEMSMKAYLANYGICVRRRLRC